MAAEPWMVTDAIEVLGWTLLHFVWQGFAAAVLLAALLLLLRRATAHARYLAACGVFGLMAFAPLITSWWLPAQTRDLGTDIPADLRRVGRVSETHQPLATDLVGLADSTHPTNERSDVSHTHPAIVDDSPQQASAGSRTQAASATAIAAGPPWLERIRQLVERYLTWIVGVWLFGVAILSLRLLAGWLSVQRLRHRFHQPANETSQSSLRRLAERLRVTRPVKLVESALVEVPTVIGWLSPLILLPASAMTGLTTEQLEALLAHELAHVRRHDYLVNLLQTVVETLLFYHPAVWWISHRIRVEREHCCDDLAVEVCGDGLTYAKALVALEELRAPKLGLAMSSRGGSLRTRVARLLGQAEQQRRPTAWIAGLLSLVLLTMAGALGAGLLTPPEKPTEGLPNNTPSATTKSTDTNEETSGPIQRRGQETHAERVDPAKRVIALVNGVAIHEADVTSRYFSQIVLEQTRWPPEQLRRTIDQLIRRDLPRIIERKLLAAEAMKFFDAQQRNEADEVIQQELAEQVAQMMKQNGVANRDELQVVLRKSGTSLERLETEFREKTYAQSFLAKKLTPAKTPEETEQLQSQLILQLWVQAELKSEYLPKRGEIRWVDRPNDRVWINLGAADGIVLRSKFTVASVPPNDNPTKPLVIKGTVEVMRIIDPNTSEARILDTLNDGPAKGDGAIPVAGHNPKAIVVDPSLFVPFLRKPSDDLGQFTGRVRLKTEKALPDLEKVVVPAGKVLDESLVFSKDGGLANVFIYLRKPTFKIEEPADAAEPKPFLLIAEDGKFWPHVALVRIGRPVVFENRLGENVNFRTQPIQNNPHNVLVPNQDHRRLPAYTKAETIPFGVKSDIHPWMQSYLLMLDHPFADITDEEGRFTINGLPPGQHDFRVWHERVGWLEKSLVVTIKPGEESRSDLEYEPNRLKLEEAEVQNWSNRQINTRRVPMPLVPRQAAPPPEVKPKDDKAALGAGLPPKSTEGNGGDLKSQISNPKSDESNRAIERGVAFLKAQQQEGGSWQGTPADGVTALCAAALLQAGVKADEPVIQKTLATMRKVEPTFSYTVALQTMVFCMASPKEDAERIRRNVTWLEQAQATEGPNRGAWSYAAKATNFGDGSCSRFAMLGLHAAKRAGFEVNAVTWRNASDYYLSSQKAGSHVWGYTPQANPTPTMTLAAMAGLAILNQHLPQDEQTKRRTEAIEQAIPFVESNTPQLWQSGQGFYGLHGLERAVRLNRWTKLGKHELSKLLDEKLTGLQRPDGSWASVGGGRVFFADSGEQTQEQKEAAAAAAKAERQSQDLIATSFALLALTGH